MYRLMLCLTALAMMTACQSSRVTIDYDTTADFSRYQQYAWAAETSGAEKGIDPLIAERVRKAVAVQLRSAQFRQVNDVSQADVLVRYYVGTYTREQPSNTRGSIGVGSAGGHSAVGLSMSFPLGAGKIVKKTEIIVDLIDPKDDKLKWRGTNYFSVEEDTTAEQTNRLVNAAVLEIFSKYPPSGQ